MKEQLYANDFAPRDGILRLHCLSHEEEIVKADSFLLEFNGKLWLIDGGMSGSSVTRDYLDALRVRWLMSAPAGTENDDVRLKLDWFVSHFHVDHAAAMIDMILPSGIVELGTLYLPPDSAYTPRPGGRGLDGDEKYRPLLAEALDKFGTGREKIINIDFGEENILRFTSAGGDIEFTVYPPPFDGGIGGRLEYMVNNYYGGDYTNKMVPVAAVNSCCIWIKVVFREKSFLFTGDLMKRQSDLDNEATDEMVRTYAGDIGKVNLLKFVHHGGNRDAAVPLMMSFGAEHIIMTCKGETASGVIRKLYPQSNVQTHNCALTNIIFSTDGNTLSIEQQN